MTKIADNKITKNLLSSELKKMITLDNGFIYSDPEFLYELCKELKQNELTQYNYLKSISAVDYIEYFELVYHLDSMIYNTSIVIKTKIYGRNNLSVKSLTSLWKGAELQEREIWDLMGIYFDGHPNMKRILLWEGFKGHPLRKDFLK
jgi:NADH-quinone oxidoreductase subunit C|tara:strand:- start:2220 stop:2660 length:441 start_codon:yes stop_codon:yes gene_type:complete